jgi:tetratricopeptide (TPR) repeat protein
MLTVSSRAERDISTMQTPVLEYEQTLARELTLASRRVRPAPTRARPTGIGQRVHELRIASGLTQTQLADGRFSKEYVSQIERGTARPTDATVSWLAERLGVDRSFLETGVATDKHSAATTLLERAEAALLAQRFAESATIVEQGTAEFATPQLKLRALLIESWAQMYLGDLDRSLELLSRASHLVEQPTFVDRDRAEVLFRLGCCRYKLNSISTSLDLFRQALQLVERSDEPSDRLKLAILERRARCYRRLRDWQAAREDIDAALELAKYVDDPRAEADVYFQASLVSERNGNWIRARSQAEHARRLYEQVGDRLNEGRLLNNLGGLSFLLGKTDEAITLLKRAFAVALDIDSDPDAGQAVSSLAQVHLRRGEHTLAEEHARKALEFLSGRVDFLDEVGNAQLVLGRALLEQGRHDEAEAAFDEAEQTLSQLSSASHRAAAWVAKGDLASQRGDIAEAARRYRAAAEALQDFRY